MDIVFLVNLPIDLAWLWATSRLAGVRAKGWRLALAACAGAAAAVWAYFPTGWWLTTTTGAAFGTALFLAIAFLPCRLSQAVRLGAYALLSGGAMAGVALLLNERAPGMLAGRLPVQIPSEMAGAGILLCLVGGRYLWEAARERAMLARGLYGLEVWIGEERATLPALLDTGNSLREPLTGAPVIVVEARALGGLLPPAVANALGRGWEALDALPPEWAKRCRFVPFRAVGKPTGMLLTFAPDGLAVRAPGANDWQEAEGLVGLSPDPLHPDLTYRALIPPALVGEAEQVS